MADAAARAPDRAAGRLVAGYRLLRPIGRGATSSVWLAEAPGGGSAVALKLLDTGTIAAGTGTGTGTGADASAAFVRAAATARALVHPDIVQVHAAGLLPHHGAWLAMEPVPGADLARYTQPGRLLPERLVVRVGSRLAFALAHAHDRGVIHRDLKPANVLAHWPSGTLKLADFGLARGLDAEATRSGSMLGSPAYMAPELLAGAVPTASSDLYAFGVLLCELLSGRRPHESDSMGTLLRQIATADAPPLGALRQHLPPLPQPLTALVAALLAKRPAQRPQAARQVAETLRRIDADWPPEDAGKP